jgi:hypothetical protein
MANVRLIKHEAVPKCGSFEFRFADGKPSRFFYWMITLVEIPAVFSLAGTAA